jgi:hypothetical protein
MFFASSSFAAGRSIHLHVTPIETRRQRDTMRLLDMPPVVRDEDPAGIQDAIGHDVDEWRRHDHAGRGRLVEGLHPLDELTVGGRRYAAGLAGAARSFAAACRSARPRRHGVPGRLSSADAPSTARRSTAWRGVASSVARHSGHRTSSAPDARRPEDPRSPRRVTAWCSRRLQTRLRRHLASSVSPE